MSNATKALTWSRLIDIEPQLLVLYNAAKAVDGSAEHFCANRIWYDRFRNQLYPLVGWECGNPEIATPEAWDLAYSTIYEALPPCRDCLCL